MPFNRRSFRFNLLMMVLLCVGLYILVFLSLGWITKHGDEGPVPNAVGRDLRLVKAEIERAGFDIEVDSSYDPTKKALVVLSQQPAVGSVVKRGRTLFLTVNKKEPPPTAMPNLVNLSFRSAALILKSNHLVLGDTVYRPDIAEGAVLEQRWNGRIIAPGTMLPQGSRVDLVIGDGLGDTEMDVPDVIGMNPDEALAMLAGLGLQYTVVWDGFVQDSSAALVYLTSPSPLNELAVPNRIHEGDIIDIRVKERPTQEEMEHNRNPSLDVLNGPDAPSGQASPTTAPRTQPSKPPED